MKPFLVLLVIILLACNKYERNCSKFKTGDFIYEYELNGKKIKTNFTRTKDLEIDYINNQIDSISVRWINDCEYILKTINPKTIAQKKAVHIKILSTKENSYNFESTIVNDPQNRKSRGTVIKIS